MTDQLNVLGFTLITMSMRRVISFSQLGIFSKVVLPVYWGMGKGLEEVDIKTQDPLPGAGCQAVMQIFMLRYLC